MEPLLGAVYGGGFSMQGSRKYEEHPPAAITFGTPSAPPWGLAFRCSPSMSTFSSRVPRRPAVLHRLVTGTLITIACNYGVRNFPVLGYRRNDVLCLLPAQPLALRRARPRLRPHVQQRPRL